MTVEVRVGPKICLTGAPVMDLSAKVKKADEEETLKMEEVEFGCKVHLF